MKTLTVLFTKCEGVKIFSVLLFTNCEGVNCNVKIISSIDCRL